MVQPASKPQAAVRRVIDLFRGERRPRQLISRGSELNLRRLATLYPDQGRALFKNLRRMSFLAVPIDQLIVPANLLQPQNRPRLEQLAQMGELFRAISEGGVLDLRKAGLKRQPATSDLSFHYRPQTLEEYLDTLGKAEAELRQNPELGDLFLFKAILRARIDLFAAGEERSALLRRGERPGVTPELQRVKDFLGRLIEQFPFGTVNWRQMAREKLAIAVLMIERRNNVAADTTLTGLFSYLERTVTGQVVERTRLRPRVLKLSYAGKGSWNLGTTGYRSTPAGISQKVKTESTVHTPELLSMVRHIIDSVRAEKARNDQFIIELNELETILPDNFGRLLEILEYFHSYDALQKDKAGAELSGAAQLVPIGTAQSLRLARELVSLAVQDLELRQEEISAHEQRFVRLLAEAEAEVGKKLADFIQNVATALASPAVLSEPARLRSAADRTGAYLGSMLKGEMREMWLRRVKSRFTGLTRTLRRLSVEVERKASHLKLLAGHRDRYVRQRAELWADRTRSNDQKRAALAKVKALALDNAKKELTAIEELDRMTAGSVRRAVEFILLAELDFRDRAKERIGQADREAFLKSKEEVLAKLDRALGDRVEALSADGQVLGAVSRRDAIALDLQYRELPS